MNRNTSSNNLLNIYIPYFFLNQGSLRQKLKKFQLNQNKTTNPKIFPTSPLSMIAINTLSETLAKKNTGSAS